MPDRARVSTSSVRNTFSMFSSWINGMVFCIRVEISFITEGCHGIGIHGPASGDVASQQGDGREEQNDCGHHDRIGRADVEELTLQEAREAEGRQQAGA